MQQWLCLETGLDAEQLSARSSSDCAPETWGLCDCLHISLALRHCLCSQPRLPVGAPEIFHVLSFFLFCFVLASISSRPETLSSE